MDHFDDFRFESHKLLVGIEAANTRLMMYIAAKQVGGNVWLAATEAHRKAYEEWITFLSTHPELISEI